MHNSNGLAEKVKEGISAILHILQSNPLDDIAYAGVKWKNLKSRKPLLRNSCILFSSFKTPHFLKERTTEKLCTLI